MKSIKTCTTTTTLNWIWFRHKNVTMGAILRQCFCRRMALLVHRESPNTVSKTVSGLFFIILKMELSDASQFFREGGQHLDAILGYDHIILDPHAAYALQINAGLDREYRPGL